MARVMTKQRLVRENLAYRHTGGVSEENRCSGFVPAFHDTETGEVYPSLCASGRPVPFHCLDGLPDAVVLQRDTSGTPITLKASLVAGFLRDGVFYTRDQAADCVATGG
ncbi:MAG: hypothetical protein JJT90_00735 [Ectothiorhodospiraceae bacterium]|nr:hypothetical protein [Ectothiorhodospiraceae bacterium]